MRRVTLVVASLLVSALFLWLALRDVPLAEVERSIRQADPVWIAISFGTIGLALWTRAVRWRGLLGFRISLRDAFTIISVTFLINQLPLRAGEVARSLLATRSGVPVVTAATSIVVERLLDTLLVVLLLAFGLSRLPDTVPAASQAALLFGIGAVAAFAVLLAFARYPAVARRLLARLETRAGLIRRLNLRRLVDHVLDGLQPLTHWRSAAHALVWTLISWAVSLTTFYTLEQALAVEGVDLWLMSVLAVSLASFSIAIPISVAAIGPFEGAVRLAGEAIRLAPVVAASLGFLFHGLTIAAYAVFGVTGLLALGVSLGDVMRAAGKQPEASQGL
ncbi:MAG: lysylphosphatidylglycerol synthase transmembrane domain-containing protein [Chloroflexota bacterium]|nr:MAG: hypothetical protein DIU68_07225 [Chloroflexota bacterium]